MIEAKLGFVDFQLKLVVEPILVGICLGLIFITLAGLFFAAYKQYRRSPMM
jgi:cytochrome b6-f complex subunit 5